jgi:acetyltransferase-like isoleucine patch superfamily enzyme
MPKRSIREWLRRPAVEKMASLRHRYWAVKSRAYYGPQFARLGRGSIIYDPIMIRHPEFMQIGERVLIRDGARLEVVCDAFGRQPQLIIESDTGIEQNVHIVCHSRVTIGRGVAIAANCAIVDVTHPFRDVTSLLKIAERIKDEDSFVEIGDEAFVGYGAVVLPNVRIGRRAVIGANSVVTRDVPDFGVAAGIPAVLLERFDQAAHRWVKT